MIILAGHQSRSCSYACWGARLFVLCTHCAHNQQNISHLCNIPNRSFIRPSAHREPKRHPNIPGHASHPARNNFCRLPVSVLVFVWGRARARSCVCTMCLCSVQTKWNDIRIISSCRPSVCWYLLRRNLLSVLPFGAVFVYRQSLCIRLTSIFDRHFQLLVYGFITDERWYDQFVPLFCQPCEQLFSVIPFLYMSRGSPRQLAANQRNYSIMSRTPSNRYLISGLSYS